MQKKNRMLQEVVKYQDEDEDDEVNIGDQKDLQETPLQHVRRVRRKKHKDKF